MSTATITKEKVSSPSVSADNSTDFEAELVRTVAEMLCTEAKRRKFGITFYGNEVRYSERGLIILPVLVDEALSTREATKIKIELEDVWNEQEPPPLRRVRLEYLWNPEISLRSTPPPLNQTV